ncbi:signal transduction histidine kinase [Rhodoglobus vestalii]|uniref:Signal transduction histidine kinase n=1 Tax=Rhodoglobus vestalii TaxID=193384 RepID=A0A8H2K7F9_9MICO|nr:ATP-binding protein [Rhodoglobus vestalii]TQO19412.1 signal transduction histidine kinase [Rhodoglobus vestalii]
MSIGLPAHLREESVSRAFARTAITIAIVIVAIAIAGVLSIYAGDTTLALWPAVLALTPLLITVWFVRRYRTLFFSVAHIVIGGAAIYWFALTLMSQLAPLGNAGQYLLTLPKIALMVAGAAALTAVTAIVLCTIGLIVAEAAVALAAWQLLGTTMIDPNVLVSYLCVVALLLALRRSQRGVRLVQSSLHRAARDDELATLRYEIEATSAAVMHDTVLGHLAAIANAPFGAISPDLQRQISRDLEVLVGEEWLLQSASEGHGSGGSAWQSSEVLMAVAEARELGLEVQLTGDLTALSLLDARGGAALGPAVKQCLVNVLKHSGTMEAEVAIFASPAEVSVLVVDAGKGFEEAETGEDRLGLRQSVRRRIELISGTVQVWSTPGLGTSVMIRVPTASRKPSAPERGTQ